MPFTLSPWFLLCLAVPVLLTGEWLVRRIRVLARFNIPGPVAGGLVFSALFLGLHVTGLATITIQARTAAPWWTWLVSTEPEWLARPAKNVNLPLLVGFFTCIGLNATWRIVRAGSWQLGLFWLLATLLAVLQNTLGVALAGLLGESPLLGLICGGVSQTGGHGTALGFAATFEQAGLHGAATAGAAAATFGLVAGGLVGGPIATRLIERFRLPTPAAGDRSTGSPVATTGAAADDGILAQVRRCAALGRPLWLHLGVLAVCIKAGAWASHGLQQLGIVFPAYMGALLVGVLVRNVWDLVRPGQLDTGVVDLIGGVLLGLFLATAMTSLNLAELAATAGPMLAILLAQVILTAAFATWITFRLLGRDYEAAVMAAGHAGFGLGATANAVANMQALTRRYGPAPRAFTIVPPTGAFLIDFTNALSITWFLNVFR